MNIQFKKGVLELCVLSILSRQNCYGYQLVQALSGEIRISEGTIYPLLKRLKDEGYVDTYLEESREGPPRKYYRLTEPGRTMEAQLQDEWTRFVTAVNRLIEGSDRHEPDTVS